MPEPTSWLGSWSTPQSFLSTLLTPNQPDLTENGSNDLTSSNHQTKSSANINANGLPPQSSQNGTATTSPTPPSDVSQPPWKQRILTKNEQNKSEINKIGDDFTEKAIVRIEGLAEDKREKAADEYIKSTNYIMKGVKNVMDLSVSIGRYF